MPLALLLLVAACADDDANGDATAGDDEPEADQQADDDADDVEQDGAEDWPQQDISWIVPFDPGGGSDVEFRRIQSHLEDILGVSVIVDYRPGGGGATGWAELMAAEPDGYTVAGTVVPNIITQPVVVEDVGYETDQFAFVSMNIGDAHAFIVRADSEFDTIEEFIEEARARPGELTVGGTGEHGGSDFPLALWLEQADIEVTYVVPDGGAGPLISDVLGGHIDAMALNARPAIEEDDLRLLAYGGDERHPEFPDVPTFDELGYGVDALAVAWGVAAPPGTPLEIRQTLADAIFEAYQADDVQDAVRTENLTELYLGPEETEGFIDEMRTSWESVRGTLEELHGN